VETTGTTPGTRWIDLDGAVNVRDVGGLAAAGGRRTAAGRLLRGDNLQDLTAADVKLLTSTLGVRTVIDLRSEYEVRSEGPGPLTRVPSVRHLHHSMLPEGGEATDAVSDALSLQIRRDGAACRFPADVICGYYLGYLEDRPDQVVAAVRAIAAGPGAVLVHCAAGKDRTGVIVALALSVAGVSPEVIAADYAATAERTPAILARLRSSPTYAADLSLRPDDEHAPRAQTMLMFLGELAARSGGAPGWLAAHGFSAAEAAQLRARLLAAP
jgi:protein-tyrosine phosphatase